MTNVNDAMKWLDDFTMRGTREDCWRWYNNQNAVEWYGTGTDPDHAWMIGLSQGPDGNAHLLGWGATPNDAVLKLYDLAREWEVNPGIAITYQYVDGEYVTRTVAEIQADAEGASTP